MQALDKLVQMMNLWSMQTFLLITEKIPIKKILSFVCSLCLTSLRHSKYTTGMFTLQKETDGEPKVCLKICFHDDIVKPEWGVLSSVFFIRNVIFLKTWLFYVRAKGSNKASTTVGNVFSPYVQMEQVMFCILLCSKQSGRSRTRSKY